MIVAERKSFDEIKELIKDYDKILILGCGTCVAVCMAGGEKEVELLATELRIASKLAGKDVEIGEATIQRQCDREYIEPIIEKAAEYQAVLSTGCGAGVQFVAQLFAPQTVIPALNTRFIGVTEAEGTWAERCRACGNCVLGEYGGICPVTMCSKGLLNGPCGGSKNEKCEASGDKDCAWILIYKRLKEQGKLDKLRHFAQARNHACQANPSRQVNEAYVKPQMEVVKK
ncbi:MAG: methylenetetrahydrofolate reductase C-terminal domain-containing protein [Chloroflexi bacterium]|nr:methylenetetrahydrofolate reductase C-terminal domain-containing protein [Chloroflexota bacterium]